MVQFIEINLSTIPVYLIAAVLPAIVLMRYVYRQDKVEKEPASLLRSLFLAGVFSVVPALVLEVFFEVFIALNVHAHHGYTVTMIQALSIGLIEEGCKLFFLYRHTWYNPSFNYRFDGVVYAVFVSLGFAAIENVFYILNYGLSVALPRAVLAIPAHMAFAVFMGYFYGYAKVCEVRGNRQMKQLFLLIAYGVASILHMVYDVTLMIENTASTIFFVIFVIAMYFIVYRQIKKASRQDASIY